MKAVNKQRSTEVQRKHSALAALASVSAEGLTPTASTKRRLDLYIKGRITADQLYQQTLTDVKARHRQTVS